MSLTVARFSSKPVRSAWPGGTHKSNKPSRQRLIAAAGMATPKTISFATGNKKKLEEVCPLATFQLQ